MTTQQGVVDLRELELNELELNEAKLALLKMRADIFEADYRRRQASSPLKQIGRQSDKTLSGFRNGWREQPSRPFNRVMNGVDVYDDEREQPLPCLDDRRNYARYDRRDQPSSPYSMSPNWEGRQNNYFECERESSLSSPNYRQNKIWSK